MRYIDTDELSLPNGWRAAAEAATREVLRNNIAPDDQNGIWRDIKALLAELLYNKCWFCETPIPRSDNAVDHFRPKGLVSDAQRAHSGYRWLAFEPGNFRYACTFCNSHRVDVEYGTSGGKAARFPLIDEAARVYEVDAETLDFDDLLRTVWGERPELLDPCNLNDWKLLGCLRENGHPCAATEDLGDVLRVTKSVEVYHLHHEPTCKQRHRTAVAFLETVRDAKAAFLKIERQNPATEAEFSRVAKQVKRMIDKLAPYSGEMIFLLRGQRSPEHPWIQHLLET